MLTIHRSKGLEFPVVYFPDLWEPALDPDATTHAGRLPRPGRRRPRTIDVGLDGPHVAGAREQHARRAARRGPAARLRRADARAAPGGRVVGRARSTAATPRSARLLFARDARRERRDVRRRGADRRGGDATASSARAAAERVSVERVGARAAGVVARADVAATADARGARASTASSTGAGGAPRSATSPPARYEARVASEPEEAVRRRRAGGPSRARPVERRRRRRGAARRVPSLLADDAGRRRRSARSCTACSRRPTSRRPTSTPSWPAQVAAAQARRPVELGDRRRGGRRPARGDRDAARPARGRAAAARRRARRPARRARTSSCRWPAATTRAGRLDARRDRRRAARALGAGRPARAATPSGCSTRALRHERARLPHRQHRPRRCASPGERFAVVDYKTNWLAAARRGAHAPGTTGPAALAAEMDARALRAAGAALHGRAAPLPALAAAGLRPRAQPRGRAVPVPARDDRAGHAASSTACRAACSPGSRRRRWSRR